jgi:DNA-directed RNA polymerase specialized sigma24 family protein
MGRQKTTVAEAISKLQEKLDVDIVLLFETGLTYQAVAERLGCSISRVQEVLRRAHKLRRDLKVAAAPTTTTTTINEPTTEL